MMTMMMPLLLLLLLLLLLSTNLEGAHVVVCGAFEHLSEGGFMV